MCAVKLGIGIGNKEFEIVRPNSLLILLFVFLLVNYFGSFLSL